MTKTHLRPKTQTSNLPQNADTPKVFSEHLFELRSRALSCIGFLIVGTIVGYSIHTQILNILLKPLNKPVFYSSPAGGFDFVLQVSFLFGFVLTVPIFMYHLIRFIQPLFPHQSFKKQVLMFMSSCLLLITGMAFAYFISLPGALYFLNTFTPDNIQALISTKEYFDFVNRYLLGFGILFQLPLILLILNSVKRISTSSLMKYQKWVFLSSFIVAAILTPTPDFFNQLIMAVPLILLYQVTILLLYFVNNKNPQAEG